VTDNPDLLLRNRPVTPVPSTSATPRSRSSGTRPGSRPAAAPSPGDSTGEIESFTGESRGSSLEEALMIRLSQLIDTFHSAHGIDLSQAESLLIYAGLPSHLSDDEDVHQRAADNTEEQFSLTVKKDGIAGAHFQNQESSNKLLKALLENEGFADAVQRIISSETWKAVRRKHAENAA
jgi:type I restriction enzyme, R subunit